MLILVNGDWGGAQASGQLDRLVENATHIVATDGALDLAVQHGIPVDTLIGDLDSLSDPAELDSRFPDMAVLQYPVDKDWTDLELAINWALEQQPDKIVLFGALGGRIDHTMTNLAMLEKGLHSGIPMTLITGNESIRLIQGTLQLDTASIGDRVSLLPISLFATVSTVGLKFALRAEKLFRAQGRGVSNVVESLPARVEVEAGVLAVVHAQEML